MRVVRRTVEIESSNVKNVLTIERLKFLLRYDPDTGHFIRLVRTGQRALVGSISGQNHQGRIAVRVDGELYFAHHLAIFYMTGKWPIGFVEHINRDNSDNRWLNLRETSHLKLVKYQLTQELLKELLHYDPETGKWTWLVARGGGAFVGEEAGATYNNYGHRRIGINGVSYETNRLIWFYMTGEWPVYVVDHIDGDPSNDRWENLRLATPKQNARNAGLRWDNTSGFKGVFWRKDRQRWIALIRVDGKIKFLGTFKLPEEAAEAYDAAAIEYFGPFARTNKMIMEKQCA